MTTLNSGNLIYRSVSLEGEYRPESYILDNRLYRQEAGYEIFTAFETSENNLFLVNRGWVSKEDFNYEEGAETYQEKVFIQGVLSPFKRFGLNLVNQTYLDDWPKLVLSLIHISEPTRPY